MTFSIVARCSQTGDLGIAVCTAIPAVGAINPFAKARVGAIATQAWSNPYLGIDGLDLLAQGLSAPQVLERLLDADADRENRQLAIVDAHGGVAGYTGSQVQPWKGHLEGDGYVVAGNLLVNNATIKAMAEAFEAAQGQLGQRLLKALEAGQAAGGDRRGKVSAALRVVRDEAYPYFDLRVDEHPEPVAELRRIFEIYSALPYLDDLHPEHYGRMQGRTRAQCVVHRENRLLMVRHRHRGMEWWCLPGGAVEGGETPAEAALRELREECNVDGIVIRQISFSRWSPQDTSSTFLVDIGDQEPKMGVDPEFRRSSQILVDVRWLSFSEIPERDRAYLCASGLLGVQEFLDEVSSWGGRTSYPRSDTA